MTIDPQLSKVLVLYYHVRLNRYDKLIVAALKYKGVRRQWYGEHERVTIEKLWHRYREQIKNLPR